MSEPASRSLSRDTLRKWVDPDGEFRKRVDPDSELFVRERKVTKKLEVSAENELWTSESFVGPARTVADMTDFLERVLQFENDRETSLNSRGATLTATAGILVTLSGLVATAMLAQGTTWAEDEEKEFLACMFMGGVALLVSAGIAVHWVLRPTRGSTTWAVLGDSFIDLLGAGTEKEDKEKEDKEKNWRRRSLLRAEPIRLKLFYTDRGLQQFVQWHFRNRRKAQWLRRAYAILGLGIAVLGATVAHVVLRRLDLLYWIFGVTLGCTLVGVLVAIRRNWLGAVTPEEKKEDEQALEEEDEQAFDSSNLLEELGKPWVEDIKAPPCCFCSAEIDSADDRVGLWAFRGRAHPAPVELWAHRTCMDKKMHPKIKRDLKDPLYGETSGLK